MEGVRDLSGSRSLRRALRGASSYRGAR